MWGFTELNGALNEPGMNLKLDGDVESRAVVQWGQKSTTVISIHPVGNMGTLISNNIH